MTRDEAIRIVNEKAWEMVPNFPSLGFSQAMLTPAGMVKALVALGVLTLDDEPGTVKPRPTDCSNPTKCGWRKVNTEPDINLWLCSEFNCNHAIKAQGA